MRGQLGGVEYNVAFLTDQVRKVDVDEDGTRVIAVSRIASPTLPGNDVTSTTEVDNHLGLGRGFSEKVAEGNIDNVEAEVIAPVDQRRPSLELIDEESEEMRLVRVV